jgi:hypothetical protein
LARSVISYFRISADEAEVIINRVQKAVGVWRKVAESKGLSKREQDLMEGAFLTVY